MYQKADQIFLISGGEPKLPKPKDVPLEMGFEIAATIIKDWLISCEDHLECNTYNFPRSDNQNLVSSDGTELLELSLPKRLIFLDEDLKSARLVSCPMTSTISYAALSYCWGGDENFKTVESTLPELERNIPLDQLPQTLTDAFNLTKKIGLDYLWIDAICIVQGNQGEGKQEWEQESRKMGRIYANAKIVLSATRIISVTQGMFGLRSTVPLSNDVRTDSICARRNLNHEIITSCRTKSDKWWETNINSTFPLLSRGWGFQERMLATRVVHFTPTELVWECQKCRKCECEVIQSNLYTSMNNMLAALRVCLNSPWDEVSMRQMWRELVRSYSVRRLTQIDDKLPAISGIAELFKEKSGDMYAAGLWKRSLPFDLLWRCDQTGDLKIAKTRSPSWSWISVDGAIKWPVSQQPGNDTSLKYISSTTYFEGRAEGVKVCSVTCELDGSNELGRVKSAAISLRTRLALASITMVPKPEWYDLHGTIWALQAGEELELAPFWPDINKEGLGYDPVRKIANDGFYVMEVMKAGKQTWPWGDGLVVKLVEGSETKFERVGAFSNIDPETVGSTAGRKSHFEG
ncbi:hypothetical protein LSUE1_G005342 [Lachnellula suecica]|uniref:Heterokaryon incompatibility domain-containing protein n=1 Tax=Lachnellula suecica TaxID=602035 RepID=A0A8T9C611_9HELO|nr:hypothetical protein LSUE1_G005342 [Lachnellula suecica]